MEDFEMRQPGGKENIHRVTRLHGSDEYGFAALQIKESGRKLSLFIVSDYSTCHLCFMLGVIRWRLKQKDHCWKKNRKTQWKY